MKLWKFVKDKLDESKRLILLTVIDNKGSSPGRQGFKMVVCEDKQMEGSIGGGAMEYNMVELAKAMLDLKRPGPLMKRQIHSLSGGEDHSGMICSGEQTIVMIALTEDHKNTIDQLVEYLDGEMSGVIKLTPKGFNFLPDESLNPVIQFYIKDESDWQYKELAGYRNRICIIGAGHVGFALSKIMKDLGFFVEIYDNRKELTTFENNYYADKKSIINYDDIDQIIPQGNSIYVVIMTFAHQSDQEVLAKLIGKKYKYLGMMGSKAKIANIFQSIGYNPDNKGTTRVYSPVGIPINSTTPMEIAVSIAAEIIKIKNENGEKKGQCT